MKDQFHTGAGGALSLERLVFFSEAVYAIAITLLVIEIEVPDFAMDLSRAEQWHEFSALLPRFFAFVLSFLVIGRYWIGHHQLFDRVVGFSNRVLWPNLILLMAVAFMPFATAFLGANLGHFVPALVYNVTLLATSLLALHLNWRIEKLGLTPRDDDPIERGGPQSVAVASALCVALTFVSPIMSQWGMISIPLWGWTWRRLVRR